MKKFVDVIVLMSKEGNLKPQTIIWEDGRKFKIDKVLEIRRASSTKAGGVGVRFRCVILGEIRDLFLDDFKWFIEI